MKDGLSLRDRALLMILGVVVLYVVAGLFWMMSVQRKWTVSLKKYKDAVKKYERENALIAQTDRWNMEYISEKEKMPMFPEGEDVDTHWMNLMDTLATTNYIAISRRQYGKEVSKGDVFELPVEVSSWEGSLEGLVKFLWDVQSNGQSMMDVSSITMRPSQKKGFLKGTFTLTCAYMRGDVAQDEDDESETTGPGVALSDMSDDDKTEEDDDAEPGMSSPGPKVDKQEGESDKEPEETEDDEEGEGAGKVAPEGPDAEGNNGKSTDTAAKTAAEE